MIDSGSDHGGSSRSVVTGGLWLDSEFWRRVSHGDGSIGPDLSAVCVDVGLALCLGVSATATCHSYPSCRRPVVAQVFGGGRNLFWFSEEASPWGDGAYEARGEHTQGPMERLSWD
ncbi:hypothetical protein YC2023_010876 [Brassica napus]